MGHGRRRSVDSSSSSDSSDDEQKKWKKAQKHKDKGEGESKSHGHGEIHGYPAAAHGSMHMPHMPVMPTPGVQHMPTPGHEISTGHPVSRGHSPAPQVSEAGHRIPYAAEPTRDGHKREFDAGGFKTRVDLSTAGTPPTYDADGQTPVFVGSAIIGNGRSVHPCKIVPTFDLPALYAFGGGEKWHEGRYDLLPVDLASMEWVPTSKGHLPPGRRPVQGGYEESGQKLYHALATVQGVRVPGKTGTHLYGACVSFGGREHIIEHYDILCWRY